jgi:opacity protein-like surface antigen
MTALTGDSIVVEAREEAIRMMRKFLLAVAFLALGSAAALAADFNGKWSATVDGMRGPQNISFNFKVDGATLTGTVTTPRGDTDISNGKVDGNNISFDTVLNFNGNSFTISYKGTIDGDTIKFSRSFPAGPDGQTRPPQEFTAKRGDAAPAPAPAPQP